MFFLKFFKQLIWSLLAIVFVFNPPILHLGFEFIISLLLILIFFYKNDSFSEYFYVFVKLRFYFYYFTFFIIISFLFLIFNMGQIEFLYSPLKIVFSLIGSVFFVSEGYKLFKNKILILFIPILFQFIYIYVGIFDYTITFDLQKYLHLESFDRFELNYLGQRGLGFSDSLAFGLAIQLGAFIFFVSDILIRKKWKYFFLIFVAISFFPLMSAGRSSIFFFLALLSLNLMYFFRLAIVFFFGLLSIFYWSFEDFRLFEYVFQFYFNFLETDSFSISSFESLKNNMLYEVDIWEWFFGKAIYYNNDGSYFGYSDSGYYRFLFYIGFLSSLFFYFIYMCLTFNVLKKIKLNKYAILCFLFLLFFLHVKGEVFNSHSLHQAIFWIFSYYFLTLKKNDI